MGSRSISG
ncbi:hypothetical protein S40293_10338 [Stachybotrys chartarum IBT 40293]|nr:hypothetical protein S40293_10338 [Stachybotrys chartarum IBT 40293]